MNAALTGQPVIIFSPRNQSVGQLQDIFLYVSGKLSILEVKFMIEIKIYICEAIWIGGVNVICFKLYLYHILMLQA